MVICEKERVLQRAGVFLVALLGLALLTGCASGGGGLFGSRGKKAVKAIKKNCPSIATLSQAASITIFTPGAAPRIENVRYDAQIVKAALDCKVKGNQVISEFGLSGRISLGPRGTAGKKVLPVFAALTLKDQDVRNKIFRKTDVTIKPGRRNADFIEVIRNFTFTLGAGKKPTDYEVLVGFDLTPTQLRYNQRDH
jgi:hypothetical protein